MLVGRTSETTLLQKALLNDRSDFIAIYGRRRVGKTFLVRETFGYRFTFQHAGVYQGSLKDQLFAFDASLKDAGLPPGRKSVNWMEAFEKLKDLIRQSTEKKKVIFIDELSWMDTRNAGMIKALENFWNGWASARTDVLLIVCASATSWMLSKVIHNKGGLYNRLTHQIHLKTFNLAECEAFVRQKGLVFSRSQILECYMVFGGVPYYWEFLRKGMSLPQNIDAMLFASDAPLKDEFAYLYASVFAHPQIHLAIIQTLAKKKAGMTREEIIAFSGIPNSGDLTAKLEELESSGFIRKFYAYGMKKKNAVYQLMDYFTLFYYQFMAGRPADEQFWTNQVNTPSVNTWMGLAFERVCLDHTAQIRKKLGISGVLTQTNAWSCKADPEKGIHGSQIDLLIVRKDQIINLCEMKYTRTEYTMTEKTNRDIRIKISDLQTETGTRYAIHPVLVTSYGLVENAWSGIIQATVVMDDLFE